MEREFVPVSIGVVMVSDAPSTLDEATGKLIVDRLVEAGHQVAPIVVVADSVDLVTARFQQWIRDTQMDVVIAMAGLETDAARLALTPLVTKPLTGFSDLFRLLTYNEIGTGAMLTEVIAAQCNATFVFVLPAAKGAVVTALDKILLPQLDLRTKPRNLVMRMARHRPAGADYLETSGPKAFPAEEHTPFGVPPAPRSSRNTSLPPPPPPKRSPSVHSTPPLPMVALSPPPTKLADIAELDPAAVVEVPASNPGINVLALEAAIEKSIEASGTPIEVPRASSPTKLDDDDPAMIAAREHAEKTPEAQAAAWVAAVEQQASKIIKRAATEREAREARKSAEIEAVKPPVDAPAEKKPEPAAESEVEAAAVIAEEMVPRAAAREQVEEPRGKIEKATGGKAAPKPDRAVDNVDAVIVEDPDLVERERQSRKMAVAKPAVDLPPPRAVEPDLPVFPARATEMGAMKPQSRKKSGAPWMLFGGVAVIAAVVLLVFVIGKRNNSVAAGVGDDPPPGPTSTPIALGGSGDPPQTPPQQPPPTPADPTAVDIEMDPHHRTANDPKPAPKDPKDPNAEPKPPKPKDPKAGSGSDDPDISKAPTNPVNTGENCDEVSCILDKFARPCCERYKPADTGTGSGSAPEKKPPINAGPVELDKTLIRIGVERFRPQIIACGERSGGVKGTVKLTVSVKPDGGVDSVAVAESPDPALGTCAAGVMRKATFAKTQNGGSFTYPFEF